MSSLELVKKKLGKRLKNINDAGYFWGEQAAYLKDFRDKLLGQQKDMVKALYGTNNNLFEKLTDDRHTTAMSCQYSSAVWCRTVLFDNPSVNVHTNENKIQMIDSLFDIIHPNLWLFNGKGLKPSTNHMIQKLQSTLGKNTPTIHKRIEAQLKGILNPNGNKFKDWPRIETKTLSTDAKTILFLATTGDGRATLIQGKFHCFAIFCESKDELYGFDNTVGCLKFEKEYLLKRFIWWAAECNDELLTNPKRYPPWTAVACWKKRNSGTSWCRGKLV